MWNESFLRTIGRWGFALLILSLLLLLSAFPFQIAHLGEIRPAFMLMAVYYWTILRPSLLPPLVTFIIGLILDLIFNYPFGMNALVLVVAQWLVRGQHKFLLGQSFLVIWAGFALVALGAGVMQWALFALFNMELLTAQPMLMSVVLSILLFPLMVLPLSRIYKVMAEDIHTRP